jgi:hypothetical protein
MLAEADGKLAAVVVLMVVDVPDEFLQSDGAKDLALALGQAGGRLDDLAEISGSVAVQRSR